ncbi:hypothetical protein J3R30DRAFT_3709660 [Lentinula aciculospora]|uniref:Uncharacterized protein n=1 Tax=Lentinula aciculospora TaxID=153920 RepID=A0A9W9A1V9_9AGAR|nr:hypothetical protein J3R30DRAFT_3709660 [Lentinula aciculospora]
MSCLEVSYSNYAPSSDYTQHRTEPRTKISIFSLLNPTPVHAFDRNSDISSVVSPIPRPSASSRRDCSLLEVSGYEPQGCTRRITKSYRKSPYPAQHERARQNRRASARLTESDNAMSNKRKRKPSKGIRISLDGHLDNADLEKEARRCRVEWLQDQANRVEAPRPVQHSQSEIKVLALWLADVLSDTFLDEQIGSGRMLVLQELRTELKALLSSCINPPTSILFLALFYMRKLFLDRFIRGHSDLHRVRVVFRGFCLALMFAFKWLDDYTHSVGSNVSKTNVEFWRRKRANPKKYRTCWADFMTMSVGEVKNAELFALKVLDWNISVSTSDWFFWLEDLRTHTIAHSAKSGYTIIAGLISAAQLELRRKSPDAPFISPARQNASTSSLESLRRLESALLVGVPVISYMEETPVMNTRSAELHSFEDEVVQRTMNIAGCTSLQSYPWTTSQFANLEGCSPLSQSSDCRTTDYNSYMENDSSLNLTPIFLDPWRVYDFKSAIYL